MLINDENLDQLIDTIRSVHRTPADQRAIDLTEYLTEFFQSIPASLFGIVTRLLRDYDDRAALKIEFVQSGCFEAVQRGLNENSETIVASLHLLIELLNQSENVQERFVQFDGYEKCFSFLRSLPSPSLDLIDRCLHLLINQSYSTDNTPPPSLVIDPGVHLINPPLTVSLIRWIPYLNDSADQQRLLSAIDQIILGSLQNKVIACSNGISLALIETFNREISDRTIRRKILALLEHLIRFSIGADELRRFCQLFQKNVSCKDHLLHLLFVAAKHPDPDRQSISAYFDLQRSNSGITLPVINRWPTLTSPHFSFHAWLRLNNEVHSYPYEGHRQIYSFFSESVGLESFFSNSSLFVLVQDQQEVVYAELKDCEDLVDGYWHSLTIVHTAQRPSRFTSALTCQLSIYIDGFLRKEIADLKYVSFVNESVDWASVGSPTQRRRSSVGKIKSESLSAALAKSIQPLAGLFSSKARKDTPRSFNQHAMTIQSHSRDALFGPSNSLFGQLVCIWMVAETLDERLVKHLHTMGPDFCHYSHAPVSGGSGASLSATIVDILSTRSLVIYHPLACNGQVCLDISGSPSPGHGRLINASSLRLNSFSQSLLNIGGCPVLYPLLELFRDDRLEQRRKSAVPTSSLTEQLDSNPAAVIIRLIHQLLTSTAEMTEDFHLEKLGEYLEQLPSSLLDEEFLLSIEQLIDGSDSLAHQLIEHLLLNFSIWNRASLSIRRSHLEYIAQYIKNGKTFDRTTFGVQFFLDLLHEHFNRREGTIDEQKPLRSIIYSIIKFFLRSDIDSKDFNAILSAVSTSTDVIIAELMDLMLASFQTPSATASVVLSRSNTLEQLYSLLIVPALSNETKTKVLKMLNHLIECEQISPETRARLRLETNQIGFGGIISGLALDELNSPIVQELLQLIFTSAEGQLESRSDSPRAIHHLNTVLTLCSAASLEVRYVAVRKLMRYFLAHPSSCCSYAKCHGWQETLAHFFVRARRRSTSVTSADEFLSPDSKDRPLDSDESSSTDTSTPVTPTVLNGDDPSTEESAEIHESASITDDDLTEVSQRTVPLTNETIITPPASKAGSRDDLLSFLKAEQAKRRPSSKTVDPTSARRVSLLPDEHETLEEMCETLILAIVMILWKGIDDSDEAAWMIRGQLFCALHHLHREYEFHRPLDYIERRLLELSMEACLNDVKLDGVHDENHRQYQRYSLVSEIYAQTSTYSNNARELIKLVHDFLCQSSEDQSRITDALVKGILPILDTMLISKSLDGNPSSPNDDYWSETSLTGLNILLILLAHSNLSICGQASIRIHSLLDYRPLSGREEAAFLLSTINRVFSSISQSDDAERYAYLLPLLTIIIDEAYDLLAMNVHFPDHPSSTAINDLRQHVVTSKKIDWQTFIQQLTEPYADHYRSMSIRLFQMNMKIWWNHCHEIMLIGVHKRNRQIATEKMKFQTHIVRPWLHRARQDQQRRTTTLEERHIRQVHLDFKWKHRRKYLDGERGPWFTETNAGERRWMQSDRENIHHMRCKLTENDHFNEHQESSRLRDNLQIDALEFSASKRLSDSLKSPINEENLSLKTRVLLGEDKERIILGKKCSLITAIVKIPGDFVITDRSMYFFDISTSDSCENDFSYPLTWLEDVYLRRNNLRLTALQFCLINRRNFLLNFDEDERREIYQKLMSMKLPAMRNISSNSLFTLTVADVLKESKATEKWMACEMSNFDYLMILNTMAGRSYNDLNQYPVFPWVLKDYTSNVLDIHNPDVFRDFSKPIGIQNPKHINEVKFKYESFEDPSGLVQKFHYGTHYSNSASVMHYLIRMEPFTTLHIHLQSGKFDIADRQFHSFQSSWTNILESPNDGKELIPEFFYLPEFLVNSNRFDLGKLQLDNRLLDDVELPPWAHQSPEEFIRLHRLALESDFVSANLHQWIDLIFGYKQTGQAAIDALNVFMYCSYENAFERESIDDSVTREAIDGMIENFGQNPAQIFTEPHPQRQTYQQAALHIESQGRPLNIFRNPTRVRAFFVDILPAQEKVSAPVIFLSIPKNQVRSFMQQNAAETLVSVNATGVVGNNGWLPYDKSSKNCFTFERDPTLQIEKNRLSISAPFSPSLNVTSRLFAVSHDAKWIFSGGHWDWSLQIYSLAKSKTMHSSIHHTDVITCLALDSTGYILITGSRDTTCVIWHVAMNDHDTPAMISPHRTLYGHEGEVTCVGVSSELDLIVSGSIDGTCNIHTVEQGAYVRTLRPTGTINDPIINVKLSDERHIVVQTEKEDTHLFLYSINGDLIRTRKFEFQVVDILLYEQYILLAVNHCSPGDPKLSSPTKELPLSAAARIIIKDLFEMTTIRTIRLRTHIHCLYLTKDAGHLLIAVKDGKLFVLTADRKL